MGGRGGGSAAWDRRGGRRREEKGNSAVNAKEKNRTKGWGKTDMGPPKRQSWGWHSHPLLTAPRGVPGHREGPPASRDGEGNALKPGELSTPNTPRTCTVAVPAGCPGARTASRHCGCCFLKVGPLIFAVVPVPTPLPFAGGGDSSALGEEQGLIIHKVRMHTHACVCVCMCCSGCCVSHSRPARGFAALQLAGKRLQRRRSAAGRAGPAIAREAALSPSRGWLGQVVLVPASPAMGCSSLPHFSHCRAQFCKGDLAEEETGAAPGFWRRLHPPCHSCPVQEGFLISSLFLFLSSTSELVILNKAAKSFSGSLVRRVFLRVNTTFISLMEIFSIFSSFTATQLLPTHQPSV